MTFTKTSATVKSLCHVKGSKYKKLNMAMVWQRQYVWGAEKASLFIHTVATNGYSYPILVGDDGTDEIKLLDGVQRITTLRKFVNNEFKLDVNTPDAGEIEIAKKTFKQLPQEMQDAILDYSLEMVYVKNATEEEIGELFYRLNQAEALTKTTLLRSLAGMEVAEYLNQFETMDFFSKRIVVSASARKTHGLTESVLQCLSLFTMTNGSFSSKDLKTFALGLKSNPITAEVTASFKDIISYLETVFPEVEVVEGEEPYDYSNLKKTNVPLLVKVAEVALFNDLDPADVFDWTESFFSGKSALGVSYKSNSASGTATKKSIRKRFGYMVKSLVETFPNIIVPSYCDFSVWDEAERLETIAKEELKAQAKIAKAIRMAETQAKRKAKAEEKIAKALAKAEEKASVPSKAPEYLQADVVDDAPVGEYGEDEDEVEPEGVYEAIRMATKSSANNKVTEEELDEAMDFIFGTANA